MESSSQQEWKRLKRDFVVKASEYRDAGFYIYYETNEGIIKDKFFNNQKHYKINLWQYFGEVPLDESSQRDNYIQNLSISAANYGKFGVSGAEVSAFGAIIGKDSELFRRMASTAGSLIPNEANIFLTSEITNRFVEFKESEIALEKKGKPIIICNRNPLAKWLNLILVSVPAVHPERFDIFRLNTDLFTASISVFDYLIDGVLSKANQEQQVVNSLESKRFKIALSFPGEKREFVSRVVDKLSSSLGKEFIFYDKFYEAELALPNLDIMLQNIYHKQAELIVVFLCQEYEEKEWCGLEFRAIRDLIKQHRDKQIMFIRFDNAEIQGLFSIDGYVLIENRTPEEISDVIIARVK